MIEKRNVKIRGRGGRGNLSGREVDDNESRKTMDERAGAKRFSSTPSSSFVLNDLGVGGRLGCGLGEGTNSHGGLVDTQLIWYCIDLFRLVSGRRRHRLHALRGWILLGRPGCVAAVLAPVARAEGQPLCLRQSL